MRKYRKIQENEPENGEFQCFPLQCLITKGYPWFQVSLKGSWKPLSVMRHYIYIILYYILYIILYIILYYIIYITIKSKVVLAETC